MKPEERRVAYPTMGRKNTLLMKEFAESLGLKVVPTPPISDKTIKIGVKRSPDMICYPFKVTLGNYVEVLDRGANTLLMYDSKGECRFKQYNRLHDFILKDMGYEFETVLFTLCTLIPKLSKLSGKSLWETSKQFLKFYRRLGEIEKSSKIWSEKEPNIGIIGELYCSCEESANHDLEDRIRKFGGNPYNTALAEDFLKESIMWMLGLQNFSFNASMRRAKRQAKGYFNGNLGGHSFENIYNTINLIERGVDGIVHIMPLTCMPESTIEPYINKLCQGSSTPLLRLYIDENNSDANLETRLETFIELIKWKRK